MKPILVALYLLCLGSNLLAQVKYAAKDIPPNLLKNADAVVRSYDLTFKVLDSGTAIATEYKAITLLNEAGMEHNQPVFGYGKLIDITEIEASVYDSNGKRIRNLKKKDIRDGKSAEIYVNDSRYKYLDLPSSAFPYTIEYRIVTRYGGLMFCPRFNPKSERRESVESASFEVQTLPNLPIRFLEKNVSAKAKVADLRWEFKQILASKDFAPYSPEENTDLPEILTAPTDFTFFGHDGNMKSWDYFGDFLWKIYKTQIDLPEPTKAKVRSLVKDCPNDRCKVERIYAFLQENTRYFYVGFGIGGWQPASALDTDRFKYGDCKGLSNYVVAMLDAVGVSAYWALILAGPEEKNKQFPDFPNAHFNHMITCVPLPQDTIWLECTSQNASCGFMGNFTDGRPALLVTPQGGQLLQTPKYDENNNKLHRKTQITLAEDGSASVTTIGIYEGVLQGLATELAEQPDEISKKYLYEILKINDFEIKSIDFKRNKSKNPNVEQYMTLQIPRFANTSGQRIFLPMNLLNGKIYIPDTDSLRQLPVQADARGYSVEEETTIQLPVDYRIDTPFSTQTITSPFGEYELSTTIKGTIITIRRKFMVNSNVFPAQKYPELINFLKSVAKSDKQKLVLVKGKS
jgi:Domain of Unknown Function with PDB structure (DUF3857)